MRVRLELHQDINITVRPCFATHNRTENRQRTNVKLRQKRSIFPQDFYNVLCIHSCTSLRDPSPASSHVRKISASATTSPKDGDFMMIKASGLSGQILSGDLFRRGTDATRRHKKAEPRRCFAATPPATGVREIRLRTRPLLAHRRSGVPDLLLHFRAQPNDEFRVV